MSPSDHLTKDPRNIPLGVALIPVVFLVAMLSITIIVFKLDAHIPLICASAVAALVASAYGHSWFRIREGMMLGIHLAMGAILILMVIGTMIGTWMLAGIVPSMIYYGLQLISPGVFLVATLLICSIVSLGTGSSWSTAGTVGVALTAVGQGLGIPAPMVAGAIISGAYFGDKMSPLSDTTNLAPAVAGTDVFSHIRHMVYTTTPGYLIALGLYALLGARFSGGEMQAGQIDRILGAIDAGFFIHPVLLLPLVLVILMVVLKIPPLPALFGGTCLGGVFAVVFQHQTVARVFAAAHSGYKAETGVEMVDQLLTRGGAGEHDEHSGPDFVRPLLRGNHGKIRHAQHHRPGFVALRPQHGIPGTYDRAFLHRHERHRRGSVHGHRHSGTYVQERFRREGFASEEPLALP